MIVMTINDVALVFLIYNVKSSAVFFLNFSDVKKPALLLALYENTRT